MRLPAAALVAVLVLSGCTPIVETSLPSPASAEPSTAVAGLLRGMEAALNAHDVDALSRLAAPADAYSTAELTDLDASVETLRLSSISLRSSAVTSEAVPGRVVASVEVQWRQPGQPGVLSARVPMVIDVGEGQASFVTARVPGERGVPIWLLGRVDVVRSSGIVVESLDPASTNRYHTLAVRALTDVERFLPPLTDELVVQVPGSAADFSSMLSSSSNADSLAAVTIEQFGAAHASIVVNPGAMGELSDLASQIVITHEAVHVALDAPSSGAPKWLQEGYADYVAFATHPTTVSEAAADLIRQVAASGPPRHLPGPRQFEGTGHGEGTAYESAWLACRWIADQYGAARLLELYRAADRVGSDAQPLRRILGLDRHELTRRWQAYLVRLAG